MSLSSAHPLVSSNQGPPTAPDAPLSPAVSELVSRFKPPSVVHPSVEPSLGHALLNCKVATATYLANTAITLITAPETFGFAFAAAAARIAAGGAALASCIEKDGQKQVDEGNRANQAADCRNAGAIPLLDSDGNVVCEK